MMFLLVSIFIINYMKKEIFRKGDNVEIINPEVFVRCGYPETVESAEEKLSDYIKENFGVSLEQHILNNFPFLKDPLLDEPLIILNEARYDTSKIINSIARAYLKHELNFGGNERRVYTEYNEKLKGVSGTIVSDKPLIRKSGTYIHSSGGRSGWHDDDFMPAYLSDIKTHMFHCVRVVQNGFSFGDSWIARENLKKVLD